MQGDICTEGGMLSEVSPHDVFLDSSEGGGTTSFGVGADGADTQALLSV
jgi:hypothetical protein